MGWSIEVINKESGEVLDLRNNDWLREYYKDEELGRIESYGSNICLGGQTYLSTSLTYNYGDMYYKYVHKKLGLRYYNNRNIIFVMNSINRACNNMLIDYPKWNNFDPDHNKSIMNSKYWYKNIKPGDNPGLVYYDADLWTEDNYWADTIQNAHKGLRAIYDLCSTALKYGNSPDNYFIRMD